MNRRLKFSLYHINPRLGGLKINLDLFQEVAIDRDFPSDNLAKGDIAILNNYVTDRSGQEGSTGFFQSPKCTWLAIAI